MGSGPSDTLEERMQGSRAKAWLLLEVNRRLFAAVLLLAFFLALVAVISLWPASLPSVLPSVTPAKALFQALTTATITAVTLVITINQLVLSQELGPVADQRSRMSGAMEFRRDVEDVLETHTSPPEPSSFLRALVDVTKARADDLSEAVADSRDEELRSEIGEYVADLTENAEAVSDRLDDAQFGTFGVLSAVLNFNYSWKIFSARRIRNDHADSLTDEAEDAFDAIVETLKFFGPAREHFKTLYFQWELVNLSRAMLYSAVPALVLAAAMIIYYDARAVPGATVGISNDILVVSFAVTVAVTPFVILLSYVLRIATVAKRTLAMGPFVLRETDREEDIEWE